MTGAGAPETRPSVAVVGLGYVGLPLAVAAAAAGHPVYGVDVSVTRVGQINCGSAPVDTVTSTDLADVMPRLHATTDASCLAGCSAVVICVPTPLDGDGRPDLGPLRGATATVGAHLRPGQLVIVVPVPDLLGSLSNSPGCAPDLLVMPPGLRTFGRRARSVTPVSHGLEWSAEQGFHTDLQVGLRVQSLDRVATASCSQHQHPLVGGS